LEAELQGVNANVNSQLASKDDLIKQLQDQVTLWRNKYEALAKLYSQLRTEHLDMLSKFKAMQLKANSAQEAVDRMERMERDLKSKNLELADMLRERDRARFDIDRQKSSHKDEIDRLRRELNFANERAEDASHSKNSEVSSVLNKYNRQIQELEDSLRVCPIFLLMSFNAEIYDVLGQANSNRRPSRQSEQCRRRYGAAPRRQGPRNPGARGGHERHHSATKRRPTGNRFPSF
jgi:chromosome segregation ATPase